MTDILAVINTLSLELQKKHSSLVDIKHMVEITRYTVTQEKLLCFESTLHKHNF